MHFHSGMSRFLSLVDEDEELPPLFPFYAGDYVGFSLAVLGLVMAAGGGIGGGGMLVPIYILALDFPVKHAIPLASATVLGGAVANNILNASKKHPHHPNRSVIDWELILQLEPMTIAGALIGAYLNDFLPEVSLVILLLLLLAVTSWKTLVKALKLYKIENEQRNAISPSEGSRLVSDGGDYGTEESSDDKPMDQTDSTTTSIELAKPALRLTALFTVTTVLNLLKGGPGEGGGPLGIASCGQTCFFAVEIAMLLVIISFAIYVRWELLERVRRCEKISSDIEWDEDKTYRYPAMAIGAGLVAGLFGIGGGIIKGPLMLALGVHPAVASATSACMILFTASTSTVSYAVFGFLVWDYALFCFLLGFASTIVGQTMMHAIMQKFQRDSYIAFCIGIVVLLSAICMTIESLLAIGGEY